MAQDSAQEAILAIAFIVESSLPVYQQWGVIFKDYLTHILKRLAESFSGSRMKVAFVTYGLADMQQSPLLCKRFFVDHQVVFKEMKDSPGKLGFGQANTGGDKGMAALEGLVAALELFDILNEPSQTKRGRVLSNYVIHVAACPPNPSRHPQWNDLPYLDNTTWDTLPHEYQKRNILYNAIILNNKLRQYVLLHSAIQRRQAESKLWFSIRATHAVLLSGIAAAEPKSTPTKRSGDVEKAPEPKRPRLSQDNRETLLHNNRVVPDQQEQGESTQPVPAASTQHGFLAQFLSKVRLIEDKVRALEAKISEAQSAGNAQLVDKLSADFRHQKDVLSKFQRRVFEHVQALKASQPGSGFGTNNPTITNTITPGQQGNPSAVPTNQQKRTGGSGPPTHNQTSDPSPSYSIPLDNAEGSSSRDHMFSEMPFKPQAKWPLEQEHLAHTMQGTLIHSSANPLSVQLPSQQSADTMRGQPNMNSSIVWQGHFIWNGHGSAGKKECRAGVVALSPHIAECRADTWPRQLTLVPTLEPAVSLAELREWMNRSKPVICQFQPKIEAGDSTNEQYYKSLIQLLVTKRVFAVAAWTLPSGAQENNVLVFPMKEQVLMGAFFPVTGIPEMPKSRPTSIQTSRQGSEVLAQLQRLPPEQRNHLIARLLQRSNVQLPPNLHALSAIVSNHPQALHAHATQNMAQAQQHINTEIPGVSSQEASLLPLNGHSVMESLQSLGMQQQLSHTNNHDSSALSR